MKNAKKNKRKEFVKSVKKLKESREKKKRIYEDIENEKDTRKKKIKQGFLVASLWITHVIAFVLLVFSYILLPAFYNAVSANAWAIIAGIVLIPFGICLAAGAAIFVIADMFKSIFSKKWWHILIASIELLFLIITVLTMFGIVPPILI